MNIDELRKEFESKAPLFEQLRREALFALEEALKRTKIKFHSLPSRVKDANSFLNKIRSKETEAPFTQIQDIVGLRVVCLYLSDVERIGSIIRKTFKVLAEDNKIEGAEVSSFGYMSVHFVVTMADEYKGPRYDSIANMAFEIQVRTIAMDAWANVSHHLQYKSDRDVPEELRKDFYALSGLFYLADRHFELFYGESKQSRKEMKELFGEASTDHNERAGQLINSDSLSAYLHAKFPDRERGNSTDISRLVKMLLDSGYSTIGDIDTRIDVASKAFNGYERENPPLVKTGKKARFLDVGVLRITMEILSDSFIRESRRQSARDESHLEELVAAAKTSYQKYRNMLPKKV